MGVVGARVERGQLIVGDLRKRDACAANLADGYLESARK
jgi:hypothetical protein